MASALPASDAVEAVEASRQEGNARVAAGDHAEALRHYTIAIQLSKRRDHTLLSNRAFAFTKLGHFGRAVEDADEAIALQPGWPKGHFRKAEAQRLSGRHRKARRTYAAALALDPTDAAVARRHDQEKVDAVAEEGQPLRFGGVGIGVGLILGILIVMAQSGVRHLLRAEGFGGALALAVVGGVVGGACHLIRESQAEALCAKPSIPNDEYVRGMFPDAKIEAQPSEPRGEDTTVGAEHGRPGPRFRQKRSQNKSYRNRL